MGRLPDIPESVGSRVLVSDRHPAAVIILAAGEGTRMKSATPKVLHAICGRTLVGHAIAAARATRPEHLSVVVRHQRDLVAAHIARVDPDALIADQDEIKGTGRATECGLDVLPEGLTGTVLVTYGDVPLLTGETLQELVDRHTDSGSVVTVLTGVTDKPAGYGRIVRDADGAVAAIVEHKDATAEQLLIQEINSGIYAFDAEVLRSALARVTTENAQQEKYLTDVLEIARRDGGTVSAYRIDDWWQTEGVNDKVQLADLGRELNARVTEKWMRAGVTIVDPNSTWIDVDVTIGADTTIRPGSQLLGATTIGTGAIIGPEVTITDSEIGDGAHVRRAEVEPLPNITVAAGYTRQNQNLSSDWSMGVSLPVPVWNQNRGNIQSAKAQVGEATTEVGRVQNSLLTRVSTAFGTYVAAQTRAERYKSTILPKAEETYQLSLKAYQGGQFEYLRVLQAQRAMVEANLEAVRSLGEAWQAACELSGLLLEDEWPKLGPKIPSPTTKSKQP